MHKWIQVTCTRGGDFDFVSNTGLMSMDSNLTPAEALYYMIRLASDRQAKGYDVEWMEDELDADFDLPLFARHDK